MAAIDASMRTASTVQTMRFIISPFEDSGFSNRREDGRNCSWGVFSDAATIALLAGNRKYASAARIAARPAHRTTAFELRLVSAFRATPRQRIRARCT